MGTLYAKPALRLLLVSLAGLLVILSTSPALAESGRFAIVAGNNHGGSQRLPLRYAKEDARRLAHVLMELGYFPNDQIHLLLDASPKEMLDAIRRSAPTGGRAELLVVFYSGHADGESLLMGEERLGMAELKKAVAKAPADVALVILDACNAGAAVQTKGGRSAPSFIRFTDARRTKGRAILTSASASELAQESDDIGSSFFTHYLVSGLRGDADRSGDRRVSLGEIYRYVYDHTVHRTADTLPGVQHPSYSYDLKGEGSVVLTDLNSQSNGIVLPQEAQGNYLIFDRDRRTVVAELDKQAGTRQLIPLSPGDYSLKKRLEGKLLVTEVQVKTGRMVEIHDEAMESMEFEHPAAKGWDLMLRSRPRRWEAQAVVTWTAFSRSPAGGIWSYPAAGVALRRRGWPTRRWATRLSVSTGAWEHTNPVGDSQIPFTLLTFAADACMGPNLEYGPFAVEFGGRVSFVFIQRRFDDSGFNDTDQTPGAGAGAYALASLQLGQFRLAIEAAGGLLAFPGADRVAIPYIAGGLTVGVGL